jgi:hypothetical protein
MTTLLARRGVVVTHENRARARRRLDEARERRNRELRQQPRERWDMGPTTAA